MEVNSFRAQYSALDRLVHRLAFRGTGWQKIVSDLEDDIYSRQLRGLEVTRPVFIASLPRAGTTLLLDLLSESCGFATHSYRNMPLVLCPLFWDGVTGPFRKNARLKERAHGDGMTVGYDSPEAFEEVVWKAFWPEKYRSDRIEPWTERDRSEEFEDFLQGHIRKIVLLGMKRRYDSLRYVSKNNANIARLELIARIFPDSRIIVPFRNPQDHVASLRRQHQNFFKLHTEDPFTAEYMASIGHFDFGAILKPLDFGGWRSKSPEQEPGTAEFWLRYWIAAFDHVLSQSLHNVTLIDYDHLCRSPKAGIAQLLAAVGPLERAAPGNLSSRLRAPTSYGSNFSDVAPDLLRQAQDLHAALGARALNNSH